jgi:hypothetical protein
MSKNSSIKQSKTILNNLNMLRYLTNYPKATWVAESLGIK